jgi:hypothetical protein
MITLYGFGRIFPEGRGHTKDLRAQWALEEIGLPCRVHALDHTGGELGSEACRRRSADIVEINYLSESDLHWLLGTLNPGSMRAEHAEAYEAIATYQKLFDTFAKVAPDGEAPTKVVRSSKQV